MHNNLMKIHTLLLFLLATVMIISLQAMNFDQEEVLNEDDWFSECPAQNEDEEPLTCDYFKRTPYWLRALGSSDRKKEKLFRRLNYDDEQYENVRCKIAGWVCAGVNPNLKLEEGQFLRTLGRTVDNDDIPVTQLLLENGANPNKKVDTKLFGLFFARNRDMAELLINHGANPQLRGVFNSTLLHFAAFRADISADIIDFYVQKKVPINAQNEFGATALHDLSMTCESHTEETVISKFRSLLNAGIDIKIEDILQETGLDKLESKRHYKPCNQLYKSILRTRLIRNISTDA